MVFPELLGAVGLCMCCSKSVFLGAMLRLYEIYSMSYDLQPCTPALIRSLGELLCLSPLITYDIYSPSAEHTVPTQEHRCYCQDIQAQKACSHYLLTANITVN